MKQRLIEQVGRSARLKVINELKRTQGLCVGDLATRLGMSYMGIKGICLDLQKRGLVDTWRQPRERGRPQMLYRLTARAHDLFPTACNEMTIDILEAAQRLFGAAAPEKLLLLAFKKKGDFYEDRVRGMTLFERATALVKYRDQEGYMPELEKDGLDHVRIIEHHSPILDVLRAFAITAKLETDLFQRLLGVAVRRDEIVVSGLYCATFHCGDSLQPSQRDGDGTSDDLSRVTPSWLKGAEPAWDAPRQ
jgi:predicted ArsR family transcriptional regulator